MRNSVRGSILTLLLISTWPAVAQLGPAGATFPLTNTRYQGSGGTPLLRTNGRDPFLFWLKNQQIRVAPFVLGQPYASRPVIDTIGSPVGTFRFDVVWTGTHFLVVAGQGLATGAERVVGRIVDANGEPQGDIFVIHEGASHVRMAFNGRYVLLLTGTIAGLPTDLQTLVLRPDGKPAGFAPQAISEWNHGLTPVASNGSVFHAIVPNKEGPKLVIFDANGQINSELSHGGASWWQWSVASDGRRFLVVAGNLDSATATIHEPTGTSHGTFTLDAADGSFVSPDALWTGSTWVVGYTHRTPDGKHHLRIATLDPAAQRIVSSEQTDGIEPSLAFAGGRVVAAWRASEESEAAITASELPVRRPEPAAYSATVQKVVATASSADATLIVWEETGHGRRTIRSGLRARDGRWREREIAPAGNQAFAASNGREFMIVVDNRAIPLDADGNPIPGAATTIPSFARHAATSNGTDYALAGMDDRSLRVLLVNPSGIVSHSVRVDTFSAMYQFPLVIASDTNGFLVVHGLQWCAQAGPCWATEKWVATVFGPRLEMESAPIVFEGKKDRPLVDLDAAWDGTRYVITWATAEEIAWTYVGSSGMLSEPRRLAAGTFCDVATRGLPNGGVAVGMRSCDNAKYSVAVVDRDGAISGPVTTDAAMMWRYVPATIEALPGGGVAYVSSNANPAAPHYSAQRLVMSIASAGLPQRPDPPAVTASKSGRVVRIEWTPPLQIVNGYRVEYRVGDGLWNEFERWHDAEQRQLEITIARHDVVYAFRVRAWNDAGTSLYSEPVFVNAGRRRAVTR